ncbi:hypothetical protein [Longimicrobium sp.]|uniref:hypothetical protein n=1 Tax=Longimicrobium sp. TaxID=2029185 RepID=UPI002E37BC92|nr:hypothetical protein [Longimicrobium sp.]HEX6036991.1 hypothetical protein [Longimicrobium sp.]
MRDEGPDTPRIPAAELPEGAYDPVGHVRYVNPGAEQGATVAAMVSWHESFHAFLNASTTFGSAMMLAGTLAEAGHRGFDRLVAHMVDLSVETHESYATVAALGAVSRGPLDAALIAGFPDYRRYLSTFLALFDPARPRLSVMALASCARAAMQTDVYAPLLQLPVEHWPTLEFHERMQPDRRLRAILDPAATAAALAAMDHAMAADGGTLAPLAAPGVTAEEEAERLGAASLREMEIPTRAAFEAFARALEEKGYPRPRYAQQKEDLPALLSRVQAFTGPTPGREWQVPATELEEAEALFSEFRHEVLVVGETPLPALFVDARTVQDEVLDAFVLTAGEASHLQLVAMPTAKARHLYRPVAPGGLLDGWDRPTLTGLRRWWPGRGSDARVDFLVVDRAGADHLARRHPEVQVLMMVSLAALDDPAWVGEWFGDGGSVPRLLVLIDEDPFQLIQELEREGPVRFAPATARLTEGADAPRVEVLCLVADARPGILYFTPASGPFRQAFLEVILRRDGGTRPDPDVLQPWLPHLAGALPHLLREEGVFGMRFW